MTTYTGETGYLQMMNDILDSGSLIPNSSGIPAYTLYNLPWSHDMDGGFPLLTTKKVPFSIVLGELLFFLTGSRDAALLKRLGVRIWDANLDEAGWQASPKRRFPGDLGPRFYGRVWRNYTHFNDEDLIVKLVAQLRKAHDADDKGELEGLITSLEQATRLEVIDQLQGAIDLIHEAKSTGVPSRRIIVQTYLPDSVGKAALPPCHVSFYLNYDPTTDKVHLSVVMRSADMFLGVPFNIASYAFLLAMVAQVTNTEPGTLHFNFVNAHVYENHVQQVRTQLGREPRELPQLEIATLPQGNGIDWYIFNMEVIKITGYDPYPFIPAPMAVTKSS